MDIACHGRSHLCFYFHLLSVWAHGCPVSLTQFLAELLAPRSTLHNDEGVKEGPSRRSVSLLCHMFLGLERGLKYMLGILSTWSDLRVQIMRGMSDKHSSNV